MRPMLTVVTFALTFSAVGADLPKVASLQAGEKVFVTMTLYGYAITGAEFLFTQDRVRIKPFGKQVGELVLTNEEEAKIDKHLALITPRDENA